MTVRYNWGMNLLAISMVGFLLSASPDSASIGAGVIDGDTFETNDGRVVRILNINTPELGTEEGKRAYYYARRLLKGKKVTLIPEGNRKGRYGRYLYHVILPGGVNYAEKVIRRGHSRYYIKYGRTKLFEQSYLSAEKEAVKKKLGIWRTKK